MKHKWHKEIVAWADGAEIEGRCENGDWITTSPSWSNDIKYRIKSQPKEKKYLYAFQSGSNVVFSIDRNENSQFYLGKIEVQND